MKTKFFGVLMVMATILAACGHEQKADKHPEEQAGKAAPIHALDFPVQALGAKTGEYVLVPPERIVEESKNKKKFFTYYRRSLSKVGEKSSQIRIHDKEETIPNALILPLGSAQMAQPGDIVLTSNFMDHNSLARGIVAEGGTPEQPRIHYLEIRELSRLDNRSFELEAGTFKVLKAPGEPGSELVCKDKENFRGVTLINRSPQLYLARTAMGALKIYQQADCQPIPLRPQVQEGDKVYVPIGAFYREGTVKKIEDRLGRLYVEYPFGKKIKERTFPYGVVATTLSIQPASTSTQ